MPFPLPIPAGLRRAAPAGTGVLVALSGGLDSTLAAALLDHLGCAVTTVTFLNLDPGLDAGGPGDGRRCGADCAAAGTAAARELGLPHRTVDLGREFAAEVLLPFVAEYEAGRTPNPCVRCNARLRFPALLRLADAWGSSLIATGHHARVGAVGGRARLLAGADPAKDQSYFLHAVERTSLERVIFPAGWFRKRDLRRAARKLGLAVAERPESQDVCFVPGGDRAFLFGAAGRREGPIVDRTGRRLGTHRGLARYTVGQRRGLGVAAPEPLYVLALDPEGNRLVVGPRSGLAVRRVVCDDLALHEALPPEGGPDGDLLARIRYRHRGSPVAAWRRCGERLEARLAEPAEGVAPGQSLVLYRGDLVVGGGRILATDCEPPHRPGG